MWKAHLQVHLPPLTGVLSFYSGYGEPLIVPCIKDNREKHMDDISVNVTLHMIWGHFLKNIFVALTVPATRGTLV